MGQFKDIHLVKGENYLDLTDAICSEMDNKISMLFVGNLNKRIDEEVEHPWVSILKESSPKAIKDADNAFLNCIKKTRETEEDIKSALLTVDKNNEPPKLSISSLSSNTDQSDSISVQNISADKNLVIWEN